MTLFCVMYITRDLIAWLRLKCFGRRCIFLLDEHVLYHQFCAFLCVAYTIVHIFGHCFGPVLAISQADTVDQVNAILKNGSKIYRLYSYQEVLFETLPGFTGFLLTIDVFLLFFLSLPCVRRRKWEVFSYSHMILYWGFMIGMILHGSATWFNPGVPFSFPFMFVASGLVVFQLGRRLCQKKYAATSILSYQMTKNNEYIYIKLERPVSKEGKLFKIRAGQYMMLAIPDISPMQWHPFSICSGQEDQTINFIIKDIGNFTKKLIQLSRKNLKSIQSQKLNEIDCNTIITENMDQQNEEQTKEKKQRNPQSAAERSLNESGLQLATQEPRYRRQATKQDEQKSKKKLRIYINGPFSAPCQSAINNKCVIFFGAGVGITPFLSYLKTDPTSIESLNFVFICRDPQLMKWITLTLDEMQYQPHVRRNITIYLFLTRRKQAHCLASFIFWRAFLKMQKLQKEFESQRDILYDLPIKISYMRPDLKGIIKEISEKYTPDDEDQQKIVSMYSCAPDSFNQRLRKISKEVQKGSKTKYYFYPEIFG